jgi:hypothetical protein
LASLLCVGRHYKVRGRAFVTIPLFAPTLR